MLRLHHAARTTWALLCLTGCLQSSLEAPPLDDALADGGVESSVSHTEQSLELSVPVGTLLGAIAYIDAQYGIDRPGGDYDHFATTDAASCRSACATDSRCASFTYVGPGIQGPSAMCWVKSTIPAARSTQRSIASGIVRENGFEFAVNRGGSDYKSFELASADPNLCKQACQNERTTCRAFSYVRPGVQGAKARCWLKSSIPAASANSDVISGRVLNLNVPLPLPDLPFPSLPVQTPGLWEETWLSLWLSEAAYWDGSYEPTRGDFDDPKRICMDNFGLTFDEFSEGINDSDVLIGHRGKSALYVAMGGSESGGDWTLDLADFKVDYQGARVHAGFLSKAKAAYPRLSAAWRKHLRNGGSNSLALVGHSLGGAMAQLMAVMLLDEFGKDGPSAPNVRVMTFGSPRVGGSDWVSKYRSYPGLASRTIRWVNKADKIAHYPFDEDRWIHVGRRFQIYDKVNDGCDLKGFDSWGEYVDAYGTDPICHPTSKLTVRFDAADEPVGFLDTRFGWHSLLDGYRVSLQAVTPSSDRDWAQMSCSWNAAYPTPVRPATCPPGSYCFRETPSDACRCLERGMDIP